MKMKWYKFFKIYLGIGIFFALSVLANLPSLFKPNILPNILFTALFLYLGITGRKKFYADEELVAQQRQKEYEKLPPEEKYKNLRKINTRIVGVTFQNSDGSSRQEAIANLKARDQLFLREYNFEEKPAYYVLDKRGNCLGNLPAYMAEKLKKSYDSNQKLVFAERCYNFKSDDYDDDDDNYYDDYDNNDDTEAHYIYGCEIAIYIK